MRNAAHCVPHVQLDLKSESGFSCVVFSPLLSGIVVYDLSFRRKARAVKFLVSKREGGGRHHIHGGSLRRPRKLEMRMRQLVLSRNRPL